MRALEERLGLKLFARSARGLTVTRSGRDYATVVAKALREIEAATRALGRPERSGRLTVATFQSFASLWLLPRLGRFRALYPEIDVRLTIGTGLVDPASDEVDLAIRFGAGDYPGCESRLLMSDSVFPVCAPSLLAGRSVPRRAGDLAELTLLHDDGLAREERRLAWTDWLDGSKPGASIHMPDGLLTLQAALLGQGVALARRSMTGEHLREGRLVRLLAVERQTDFSFWLITAAGEQGPRTEAFVGWILNEAGNGW
jgi:LysR family glycine cleavage system transcriptional activator